MAAAFALTRFTGPYRGDLSSEVALRLFLSLTVVVSDDDNSVKRRRQPKQQMWPIRTRK